MLLLCCPGNYRQNYTAALSKVFSCLSEPTEILSNFLTEIIMDGDVQTSVKGSYSEQVFSNRLTIFSLCISLPWFWPLYLPPQALGSSLVKSGVNAASLRNQEVFHLLPHSCSRALHVPSKGQVQLSFCCVRQLCLGSQLLPEFRGPAGLEGPSHLPLSSVSTFPLSPAFVGWSPPLFSPLTPNHTLENWIKLVSSHFLK